MTAFSLADLHARHAEAGSAYLEFLREPSLSLGLYKLPAGATDPQQPHAQDEVYYVIAGQAVFQHAGADRPVTTGDTLYVAANEPHHFHSITDDLSLLVVFAPAEGQSSPP